MHSLCRSAARQEAFLRVLFFGCIARSYYYYFQNGKVPRKRRISVMSAARGDSSYLGTVFTVLEFGNKTETVS